MRPLTWKEIADLYKTIDEQTKVMANMLRNLSALMAVTNHEMNKTIEHYKVGDLTPEDIIKGMK